MANENLQLAYTILCDDVRLEMGNKLSLMGIFQNIMVERVPVTLIKFAVVQHWTGAGNYMAEVRILSPDKMNVIVTSQPTQVVLQEGGFADNVSFFVNPGFPVAGTYAVQTLINSNLFNEFPLIITEMGREQNNLTNGGGGDEEFPDIVN
jgi:hypothetical protein